MRNNGKKPVPNAMVIDERTRTRDFIPLEPDKIPADSFEKHYEGRWFHLLGLDLSNEYWTILPPTYSDGHTPTDLYVAKHCAQEVEEVYGLSTSTVEKIMWGIFIGIGIAELIVIFLLVMGFAKRGA